MKEILIINKKSNQHIIAKIDDEDFEKVNQYKWHLHPNGYAKSNRNVFMHHLIMGNKSSEGLVVDHKNQDKLDNRRENLNFVTKSQNSQNVNQKKNKNGFIGICITKSDKYLANINDSKIKKKRLHSKVVDSPIEAAKYYDILAFHIYGKLALTNKLISYEDAIKIKLEEILPDLKERDLPKYITKTSLGYFQITRRYKNQKWKKSVSTLEQAIETLNSFNEDIQKIKNEEEINLTSKSVAKDDYGCYILTNKNVKVYLDEKHWQKINRNKWYIDKNGYVYSRINYKNQRIHRFIVENIEKKELSKNQVIDHINHNRLDNRIENLRIVSSSENNHNRKKRENTSSKYIGISLEKNRWRAKIIFQKQKIEIGSFETEKEAALAYNRKAIELYGDKAKVNQFDE